MQPKSQDYLLKIQYFCNFSLVSFRIHPRSRRGAHRIRKGEGRWSRRPKAFTCFIRSSPADVKQNKQTLKPCRRQAKQTLESMPPQNLKTLQYQPTTAWKWCQFCKPSRRCRVQDTTKISGIPPRHAILLQLLACLARHPSAFTSMCGTDTAGRGAFEPPPEDGARTKLFDREFQFRELHTEAETKKNSWPNPWKEEWSYTYTRAPHGRRHSPAPMLRVGQGSTSTT